MEKIREMTTDASFFDLILESYRKETLNKVIFSQPKNKKDTEVLKVCCRLCAHRGQKLLAAEYTLSGDTVAQRNLRGEDEIGAVLPDLIRAFGQVNLLTALGDAELRTNKSGARVALGAEKLARKLAGREPTDGDGAAFARLDPLEKEKKRMLSGAEDFLIRLGVSDKNGRVHDKKQGKFRQINRFLEYLDELYPQLPAEGTLTVYDLCCGKSYLSFAVYY